VYDLSKDDVVSITSGQVRALGHSQDAHHSLEDHAIDDVSMPRPLKQNISSR
jgi:hypothetical protein